MAHYAYKCVAYDIDYPYWEKLIKRFEKEMGRAYENDANYDGDNWYIAEMWIRELIEENAKLKAHIPKRLRHLVK